MNYRPALPLPTLLALAAILLAAAGCRHDAGDAQAYDALLDDPVAIDAALHRAGFEDPPLAGHFSAGGITLELHPDGHYRLLSGSATVQASEGLWSLEPGSGQLLLVPHAADEPRRRYSMPSGNELVPEDDGLALLRHLGTTTH